MFISFDNPFIIYLSIAGLGVCNEERNAGNSAQPFPWPLCISQQKQGTSTTCMPTCMWIGEHGQMLKNFA